MPSESPDLGDISTFDDSTVKQDSGSGLHENSEDRPQDLETRNTLGNMFDHTEEKVIREDVLQCLSRKHKHYRVVLTSSEILLQLQGGAKNRPSIERYSIDDLFGCHTLRHKQYGPSFVSAYVCFYIYPRRKRVLMSKAKLREKVPLVFEIRKSGNSYEENLSIAMRWKEDALQLLKKKYPKFQGSRQLESQKDSIEVNGNLEVTCDIKENGDVENSIVVQNGKGVQVAKLSLSNDIPFVRRYFVIINPVSGQGKGVAVFNEKVHPILVEAGIKVELLITTHAGHAMSVVSSTNLDDLDGILTVGGDGLLYEVVNALQARLDSDKASYVPVGAIASGSGNGLARSIAQYSKEDTDYLKNPVLCTTLAAARGKVIPVNLMEVQIDGKKSSGFLSVGWGLISDIDVESEVLRAIGEPRFTLWSFLRLAKLRSYKAQLSYIPCEKITREEVNGTSSTVMRQRDPVTIESEFISVYSSCQSFIGTDMIFAPGAKPGDGLIHLTYVTKDAGRAAALQFLLGIEKGNHLNVSGVNYVTVQEFSLRSTGGIEGTVTVDGERVKAEEIRVKVSPQSLHVFAL